MTNEQLVRMGYAVRRAAANLRLLAEAIDAAAAIMLEDDRPPVTPLHATPEDREASAAWVRGDAKSE